MSKRTYYNHLNSNQYLYTKIEKHITKLENSVKVEINFLRELLKGIKIYNKGGNAERNSNITQNLRRVSLKEIFQK